MNDNHDDRLAVYEIGYLIIPSVSEEHIPTEVEKIKKIITDAGASVIAEEMPHRERLAYAMRRKTVSGSYEKYQEAYFGWTKFELSSEKIEGVKNTISIIPSVLRMLVISTVRENTYLGRHASEIAASISPKYTSTSSALVAVTPESEKPISAPATIEEMDKSIDEMVKEVNK